MANDFKTRLLVEIEQRFGRISRLPGSQSLIELKNGIRVYLRYSKLHGKGVALFGLRRVDLNSLDGHPSYLCFFTDREPPLFIPYGDFEAAIRQSPLASENREKRGIRVAGRAKSAPVSDHRNSHRPRNPATTGPSRAEKSPEQVRALVFWWRGVYYRTTRYWCQ